MRVNQLGWFDIEHQANVVMCGSSEHVFTPIGICLSLCVSMPLNKSMCDVKNINVFITFVAVCVCVCVNKLCQFAGVYCVSEGMMIEGGETITSASLDCYWMSFIHNFVVVMAMCLAHSPSAIIMV